MSKILLLFDGRKSVANLWLNHSPELLLFFDRQIVFQSKLLDNVADIFIFINYDFGWLSLAQVDVQIKYRLLIPLKNRLLLRRLNTKVHHLIVLASIWLFVVIDLVDFLVQ